MPFVTTSDIASYLGTTFDGEQVPKVQLHIDAVLSEAQRMVGYDFANSQRIAFYDGGRGQVWLPVPRTALDASQPITVSVYSSVSDQYESFIGSDFRLLSDGSLNLLGVGFGREAVRVEFTAGWKDDDDPRRPADLKQALIELVAAKWATASNAGAATGETTTTDAPVKSVSIGSYRQEFAIGADASSAFTKLQTQAEQARLTLKRFQRGRVY